MLYTLKDVFPHKHARTDKETAQDILLLLYLLKRAGGKITDKSHFAAQLKLMKLVFLSEYQMVRNGQKGFNFFFNIFKRGPSSMELLKMVDYIRDRGLISEEKNSYSVGKSGALTIDDFLSSNAGKNKEIFNVIDSVVDEFNKLTTEQLLAKVYSMDVIPMHSKEKINIAEEVKKTDGKPGKRLLMRMEESDVKHELEVDEDWIETVRVLLNPAFSTK